MTESDNDGGTSSSKVSFMRAGKNPQTVFLVVPLQFDSSPLEPTDVELRTALPAETFNQWSWMTRSSKVRLSRGYTLAARLLRRELSDLPLAVRELEGKRAGDSRNPLLWEVWRTGPSFDFHPFIRRLMGYGEAPLENAWNKAVDEMPPNRATKLSDLITENKGTFRGLPTLQLCSPALMSLQGGNSAGGQGFALPLRDRAVQRLRLRGEAHACATLKLSSVTMQIFGTGVALAALEFEVKDEAGLPANLGLIQEVLYLLGRPEGTRSWVWKSPSAALSSQPCPSALDIIDKLIQGTELTRPARVRLFTYCSISVVGEVDPNALKAIGARLACRYTDEYLVKIANATTATFEPFSNVLHTMSDVGGAVLVSGEENVEHLRNYTKTAVRPVYLPLALLAVHEQQVLIALAQKMVGFDVYRSGDEIVLARLRELHRKLVQFRLEYRFSLVSVVPIHNQAHQAWRQALGLDTLMAEATGDMQDGDRIVSDQARSAMQRRTAIWDAVAAAFAVVVIGLQLTMFLADTAFIPKKEGLQIRAADPSLKLEEHEAIRREYQSVAWLRQQIVVGGLSTSVLGAIAAYAITLRRRRSALA